MSADGDLQDLLDAVSEEPGWRLERATAGWRIYPADRSKDIIHTRKHCGDHRSLQNLKATLRRAGFMPLLPTLRRAGFTPLLRQERKDVATLNGKTELQKAISAPAAVAPRDLVAEARGHISRAIDALSALEGVLGEISLEQEGIKQIKTLLQQLAK